MASRPPQKSLRRLKRDVLLIDRLREPGKALSKIVTQIEELEFLRNTLLPAHLTQVIHLAAQRGLAEVLRVGEKSEVALADECGNDAGDEQKEE